MKPQCLATSTWQAQITTGIPSRLAEASPVLFLQGVHPLNIPRCPQNLW